MCRWGKSAEGVDLLALHISSQPQLNGDVAKPQFKYVGNIHGDEPSGRCVLGRQHVQRARSVLDGQIITHMSPAAPQGSADCCRLHAACMLLETAVAQCYSMSTATQVALPSGMQP